MNQSKRLDQLEGKVEKIEKFLPNVELWLMVLAEQFKLNRNFILSLDKKPEPPKTEGTDAPVPAPAAESNPVQK